MVRVLSTQTWPFGLRLLIPVRQCTKEFMSIEARSSMYRFQPQEERVPTSDMLTSTTTSSNDLISLLKLWHEGYQDPIWAYNHLHDLESVWWVMASFLFTKDFKVEYAPGTQQLPEHVETPERRARRIAVLEGFAASLFKFVTDREREHVFCYRQSLNYGLERLPPFLRGIGLLLNYARLRIMNAYIAAEQHYPVIIPRVEPKRYQELRQALAEMKGCANNEKLKYTVKIDRSIYAARRLLWDAQEAQVPASKPTKRKQEDDTTDAVDGALPDPSSSSAIVASANGSKKARTDTA